MSRNSSREASIEPQSNRRFDKKDTVGNDVSDSEQDRSPYRPTGTGMRSTFAPYNNKGRNILSTLGENSGRETQFQRWHTVQDKPEPSETNEQTNLASHVSMANPSGFAHGHHLPQSRFSTASQATQLQKQVFLADLKRRNMTENFPNHKLAEEEPDDTAGIIDKPSGFRRNNTLRKLTGMLNANNEEAYKKKYRDFVPFASGSYAVVERCQRKEDGTDFVMKFMNKTKVADKIKNLLGISDGEAKGLAEKLCDNELNISNALGSHPNISSIEDSYVDKAKEDYRFFSRKAELSTLMSDVHMKALRTLNGDSSDLLTVELVKAYFRDVVEGVKHSSPS